MPLKDTMRARFIVRPKHQVMIRGIEAKECQAVELSEAEYEAMDIGGYKPVVPVGDWPEFLAAFNAGEVDHKGDEIQPAQEAEENAEPAGE